MGIFITRFDVVDLKLVLGLLGEFFSLQRLVNNLKSFLRNILKRIWINFLTRDAQMMSRKETRDLLTSMSDKGYAKIGVIFKGYKELDILLIHKDWKTFDFHKHFIQAMTDIPEKLKKQYLLSLEVPTLEMYGNDRTEDAPKHQILVDLGPYPQRSFWQRKGFFYYAKINYYSGGELLGTITKKLDFVSYHLIRKIHGVKGLNDMAMRFKSL